MRRRNDRLLSISSVWGLIQLSLRTSVKDLQDGGWMDDMLFILYRIILKVEMMGKLEVDKPSSQAILPYTSQ
jgi:hypothetical protein